MSRRHMALIALVSAMVVLVAALAVVSCGGSGAATTTGTPATTAVSADATGGAALYAANCARCHESVPSESADQVAAIVESGKEDMPAFKDTLTREEIAAIVSFVTTGGQ
jgi:mono/diheme cytochrome c family protein